MYSSFGQEFICSVGDPSSIPGSRRSAGEGIGYPLQYSWASLVGSTGKESAYHMGDLSLIPGLGRSPGARERLPTPVVWPGEFHGLYSPWGCKESDTTEWLSLSLCDPGLQHARLLCSPLSPRVCSNSRLLRWWCYLTISSSAAHKWYLLNDGKNFIKSQNLHCVLLVTLIYLWPVWCVVCNF